MPIQDQAPATTPFCPFKAPLSSVVRFGTEEISTRRFEHRPGMSLVCAQLSPVEKPAAWPLASHLQIVYIAAGQLHLTAPDNSISKLTAGDWFILKTANSTYRFNIPSSCAFHWIECDEQSSQSLVGFSDTLSLNLQKTDTPYFAKGDSKGRLNKLGNELSRLEGDNPRERLLIESKTLEWLALLLDHPVFSPCRAIVPQRKERDENALIAAARILESKLDAPHSIAQLSRAVHLNEFKLKKGFRERFNTTIFGYLRQKRMEQARTLLRNGERSIIEIANTVGYANPSHFARAFKEAYGMNPSDLFS